MADEHTRDELAQLRTLVEAQQVEFAAYRARHERPRRRIPRLPRRFLPLALVALLVALVPLATLAASPFNDLTGGVHDANIGLINDAGITKGCVPNVSYCPTANVTREEMASFLARTAGLGTNPPVVNAKTATNATNATHATSADSATSATSATTATNATHATTADTATNATNATHATTADNATTVGGYAPNGLVRIAIGSHANLFSGQVLSSLQTARLTAPAAGFVLVTATTNPFTFSGGSCPCGVAAQIHHITSDTSSAYAIDYVPNGASEAGTHLALTWVFPVTAGVQDFEILGSTAPITQYNPTLTLLYVPFGSGGAGTLEASPASSSTPPITVP